LATVFFAAPVILQVALMLQPSMRQRTI